MNTNKILSILIALVLGWVGSLSIAQASVGANPNDYTKKIVMERFDKVKADFYYASKVTGIDMGDLVAMSSIESTLVPNAKVKASVGSSGGLLGHTDRTWARERKTYHAELGLPANVKKTNPRNALLIGAAGMMEDRRFLLEKTHLTETSIRLGDQYMAHFLGRDMAAKVINSNSNTSMSKMVRISKANWSFFVKPNGQVRTSREFRQYLDTIAKRERSFYAQTVKQYAVAKNSQEVMSQYDPVDAHMALAQTNTSKYVGWGEG